MRFSEVVDEVNERGYAIVPGVVTGPSEPESEQYDAGIACEARAGDALVTKPLLLHASSKSTAPTRRRVLHLECADFDLSDLLCWASLVRLVG